MNDHHIALIHTMVLVSAADGDMRDSELISIGDMVRHLPIFREYDPDQLTGDCRSCAEALSGTDGLERVLDTIVTGLPAKLAETAYALGCDIAAADGRVSPEEMRLLEMLRHRLEVDRLTAAAIERGARARHRTI